MSPTLTDPRPPAPQVKNPAAADNFTGRAARTSVRGRWRVALRYARRQALRAKGRSVLILIMVMLPVAVGTLLATVTASGEPTIATLRALQVGPVASARIGYVGSALVVQNGSGRDWGVEGVGDGPSYEPESTQVASLADYEQELAAVLSGRGSLTRMIETDQSLAAGLRSAEFAVTQADLSVPATRGLFALSDGTLPESESQIALSERAADDLHTSIGSEVTITEPSWTRAVRAHSGLADRAIPAQPTTLTVTGILSTVPGTRDVFPAAGLTVAGALSDAETSFSSTKDGLVRVSWLVSGVTVDWGTVGEINRTGSWVMSRDIDPEIAADVAGLDTSWRTENARNDTFYVFLVLVIGLLQSVLMAGPAFAVGAKRSERDLLQLSTNGADRRTITLATLSTGLLIGVAASIIGLLVGIATVRIWWQVNPALISNLVWPWGRLAIIAVTAVLIAVIAAWLPARAASKAVARGGARGLALPRIRVTTMNWLGLALAAAGAGATPPEMPPGTDPGLCPRSPRSSQQPQD